MFSRKSHVLTSAVCRFGNGLGGSWGVWAVEFARRKTLAEEGPAIADLHTDERSLSMEK